MLHGVLYWNHHNNILLRCLEPPNLERVLRDHHDGPIGEHFSGDTTTHKVMRDSYYCSTLFNYAHA